MKNVKKHILYAVTLVIAGLVITSAVSITAAENKKNITEKNIIRAVKLENQYFEICPNPMQLVSSHKINYAPTEMIPRTVTLGTDVPILVAAEEFDIENPCLLDNGGNTVIAIAEAHVDIGASTPVLRYSNDGGNTWIPEDSLLSFEGIEDYVEEMPAIDFAGDNGGFGSMIPIDPFELFTLDIDDVTDYQAGEGWTLTGWTTEAECDSVDVYGINSEFSPDPYARGIVGRSGDDPSGPTNVLYLGWREGENTLAGIWTGGADDVMEWENMDCDADLITGLHYETYETYDYEGYPDGVQLQWCQLDGTGNWWQGDWWWTGGVIEGATNPDVKSDDGNCYLVYELDDGIECLYSNDNGQNFNEVVITDNGQFPAITAVGETAVCSYTRNGNLYTSISEDGGDSWEEKTQINDESSSVVEQPNCQHVSGMYIAWADDRNAPPIGIYFDVSEIGNPPGTPTITGRSTGTAGTSYDYIFNAVDPDGDDVKYIIDWGDENSDMTGFNPSGDDVTVSHTWSKKDTYTITAKAQDSRGLVGPATTKIVTMPRNRAIMNTSFQWFLQQHPYLFPILKLLLQRLGLQ